MGTLAMEKPRDKAINFSKSRSLLGLVIIGEFVVSISERFERSATIDGSIAIDTF